MRLKTKGGGGGGGGEGIMHKGPRRNNPCVREIQYHSKITMDRVAPISMSGRDGPFVIIISHTKQKRRRRRRNNNTKNSAHCAPARHSALFFSCNSSPTRSDRLCGTQSQLQLEKETNSNNNKHNSARGTLRQARPSAESNTARLGSLFPFALYRDDYRARPPGARVCCMQLRPIYHRRHRRRPPSSFKPKKQQSSAFVLYAHSRTQPSHKVRLKNIK